MRFSGGGTLRRSTRVVADTVVGYAILTVGVVMLVTPGPGLIAIVAGLALLSRHYHFAAYLRQATVDRFMAAGADRWSRRARRETGSATAARIGEDVEAA